MALDRNNEFRRSTTAAYPSEREQTNALLRDLGVDEIVIETVSTHIEEDEVQSVVSKLRTFAEENPRIVLGALSALIAGGAAVAGRAVVKKKKAKARSAAKSKSSSKSGGSKPASKGSKRTLIEPHPGDKRYIRRDARGRIKESDDVSRSLSADQRRKAKARSSSGSGDEGDR